MTDTPERIATPAARATKLCELADDLYVLLCHLEGKARIIYDVLFKDDSSETLSRIRDHIQFVADSLPRLDEVERRLNDPDLSPVVAAVYRHVSKEYLDTARHQAAYQSRCLERVVSHLKDFASCANAVVHDHASIFLDEADSFQLEKIGTFSTQQSDRLSAALWRRAGVLVAGAEHEDPSRPPFADELKLFPKAVDYLVDIAHAPDPDAPVSLILNKGAEVCDSLADGQKMLYRALNRRRNRWVDFDTLLVDVWGWNLLEGSEPVERSSITKAVSRLSDLIGAYGLKAEARKVNNCMMAMLSEISKEE